MPDRRHADHDAGGRGISPRAGPPPAGAVASTAGENGAPCPRPRGPELIAAYVDLSAILRGADALDAAVDFGTKALELAERLNDRRGVIAALVCIGGANIYRDRPEARKQLEEALELADREGPERAAGYAYAYLVQSGFRNGAHEVADSYVDAGLDYCTRHDLEGFAPFLVAM